MQQYRQEGVNDGGEQGTVRQTSQGHKLLMHRLWDDE